MRLSGDVLQLPPVKSSSFAGPSLDEDDEECCDAKRKSTKGKSRKSVSDHKPQKDDPEASCDEEDDKEAECGLETFRRISNVICLTKIVRAPNSSGALCICVRYRKITDAVWALLESRLIRSNDARLQQPPFSTSPCKIIFQRHLLRSGMSNEAVLAQAPTMSSPVYLVVARDDVETADEGIRIEI